jgi:hypothetical protein
MEEESEESIIASNDPNEEEEGERTAPFSFLSRVSSNFQGQRSNMFGITNILGRMPTATRGRLFEREEENKSSEEDVQPSQIGINTEWYYLIPESHEEFVRELIDQFGPIILYVYGRAISSKLIENFSNSAEVINKLVTKMLEGGSKLIGNAQEMPSIMRLMYCLPNLKIMSEQINLVAKGMLHSRVIF